MIPASVLCDAPSTAISYAVARASGEPEDMAIDTAGKRAGRMACGVYRGSAVIVEERVVSSGGEVFKLTAWRFVGKRPAVAWRAEAVFVPGDAPAKAI